MKAVLIAIFFVATSTLYVQSEPDLTGYKLVFEDNFNVLSVQAPEDKGDKIWLGHPPYGPASHFSFSHWSWDRRTLRVKNGHLVNTAWYDPTITNHWTNWRSGAMSSMDRNDASGFAQRFGYFEARMRMPQAGQGAFPAFWLASKSGIPNAGTKGYEIDIIEWFGGNPRQVAHTVHEWNADGSQGSNTAGVWADVPGGDTINTWHTYGCLVHPDYIRFYVDGVMTAEFPYNKEYGYDPLYIIINYALQSPLTSEPYRSHRESSLLVDYVRAWSLPANIAIPPVPKAR
jgi:beta-glucanase (GH16 family)